MTDRVFVDTNILVYAHDRSTTDKNRSARRLIAEIWDRRIGVLSTQVIQELYVNVRRKASNPIAPADARRLIEDYLQWQIVVNDGDAILGAIAIEKRYRISFWDALVVHSAGKAGVSTLYSEDLGHGQRFGSVRVVNPFAA